MKRILRLFALGAAAIASNAMAGVSDFYDGPTGATCNYFNAAAHLSWRRPGGDWRDANGELHGSAAFATARITQYQVGTVDMDVTSAVRGGVRAFLLRKDGGELKLHSSETAAGPQLVVTRADGSTVTLRASADASLGALYTNPVRCQFAKALGTSSVLQLGGAAGIEFPPLPTSITRAVLHLTIVRAYADATLQVFRMSKPSQEAQVAPQTSATIAHSYPGDRGMCADSRMLYCESWDNSPADWWTRTGGYHRLDAPDSWDRVSNGVAFPDGWPGVQFVPNAGYLGNGLQVTLAAQNMLGSAIPSVDFVGTGDGEQEHLFYRYYVKFSPEFKDPSPCGGGKLPGLASDTSVAGNGGSPVDGTNGWSLRGGYRMNCDQQNPIYPQVMLITYAYHGDMKTEYGDDWYWVGNGETGLAQLNRWYCVEGEVRVNTPGVRNGVLRTWVNGQLAFEKKDLYLRARPPYEVHGNLGIRKFWGTVHHGGSKPFGHTARVWFDQTAVATSRIGCVYQP